MSQSRRVLAGVRAIVLLLVVAAGIGVVIAVVVTGFALFLHSGVPKSPHDVVSAFAADAGRIAGVAGADDPMLAGSLLQSSPQDGIITVTISPSATTAQEVLIADELADLAARDATGEVRLHAILVAGNRTVGISRYTSTIRTRVDLVQALVHVAGLSSASVLWNEGADKSLPDLSNTDLDVRAVAADPAGVVTQVVSLTVKRSASATVTVSDHAFIGGVTGSYSSELLAQPSRAIFATVSDSSIPAVVTWLTWLMTQTNVTGYLYQQTAPATVLTSQPSAALTNALASNLPPNATILGTPRVQQAG